MKLSGDLCKAFLVIFSWDFVNSDLNAKHVSKAEKLLQFEMHFLTLDAIATFRPFRADEEKAFDMKPC